MYLTVQNSTMLVIKVKSIRITTTRKCINFELYLNKHTLFAGRKQSVKNLEYYLSSCYLVSFVLIFYCPYLNFNVKLIISLFQPLNLIQDPNKKPYIVAYYICQAMTSCKTICLFFQRDIIQNSLISRIQLEFIESSPRQLGTILFNCPK